MRLLVGLRNWKLETGNWSRKVDGPGFHFRFSNFHFPFSNFQVPFSGVFARLGSQLVRLILAAVTFGLARVAYAQGCAMCYTSASAAKAGAIQALRSGTLILLIPPLLMFVATAVVVIRRRNQFNENPEWTEEEDRELRNLLAGIEPAGEREAHRPEVESHSPVS